MKIYFADLIQIVHLNYHVEFKIQHGLESYFKLMSSKNNNKNSNLDKIKEFKKDEDSN